MFLNTTNCNNYYIKADFSNLSGISLLYSFRILLTVDSHNRRIK